MKKCARTLGASAGLGTRPNLFLGNALGHSGTPCIRRRFGRQSQYTSCLAGLGLQKCPKIPLLPARKNKHANKHRGKASTLAEEEGEA